MVEDKSGSNIFISYLWPILYLILAIIAAVFALVLEGDAASKALGWFITALVVFLISIPMSRKNVK